MADLMDITVKKEKLKENCLIIDFYMVSKKYSNINLHVCCALLSFICLILIKQLASKEWPAIYGSWTENEGFCRNFFEFIWDK